MATKKLAILSVLLLIFISSFAIAEEYDCLYFFYGKDCPPCLEADNHLQQLQVKYPKLTIKKFEVYYDRENERVMNKYFDGYKISAQSRAVPALFMPGSYFVGYTSIKNSVEGRILANEDKSCPQLSGGTAFGVLGESKAPHNVLDTLTLSKITGAAIDDSLRLGMLGVLAILLSLLVAIKDGETGMRRGVAFIGVLFAVNLLFSLGFLSWFASAGWYNFFSKVTGMIALVFGVIHMKKLFVIKHNVLEEEIADWRKKLDASLQLSLTVQGVLGIGFMASLFSLGKTTTLFGLLRSFFMDNSSRVEVFPFVLYHLLVLIVPAAIIVALYYFGSRRIEHHAKSRDPPSDMKIEHWRKHNRRVFEFSAGLLLVLLGLILVIV